MNSRFAATVADLIQEEFNGSNVELARHVGMSPSLIGYYSRPGETSRFPTQDQLARLCRPLDEAWQRKIVAAYMHDHIPPEFSHLVKLSGMKDAPKPRAVLPREVEAVFERLRDRAARDNDVRNWLMATARAMFGAG